MAKFTRKALTDLEIPAEKIDAIMNMHVDVVNEIKDERDKYKEDAEKLTEVQKQLDEAKKAAEAKKPDESEWEKKYNDTKKELDDFKAASKAKDEKAAKTAEYKRLIIEAGIPEKRAAAILKVADIDSLKIDKDGKAEDADKIIESIKTDYSDFVVTKTEAGANTAQPPAGTTTDGIKTKDEIMKMTDANARQAEIAKIIASGGEFK